MENLILSAGAKTEFTKKVPIKDGNGKVVAEMGYDGVKVRTPAGVIELFPDKSVSGNTLWAGDINVLDVVSIGECPHWITDISNQNKVRTLDSAAAVEARLVSWPQMALRRPGSWGRFDWS